MQKCSTYTKQVPRTHLVPIVGSVSLLLLHHHPSQVSLYRPVLALSNSLFKGLPSPSSSIWSVTQNCIASQILNLGISWKYVVTFMPGPIDSWGNSPWYLLHWELGEP